MSAGSFKDQLQAWKATQPAAEPTPESKPSSKPSSKNTTKHTPSSARDAGPRVTIPDATDEGAPVELSDEELFLKAFEDVGDGAAAILEKYDATDPKRRRPDPATFPSKGGTGGARLDVPDVPVIDSAAAEQRMFLDAVSGITPMEVREQKPGAAKGQSRTAARFARRVGRGEIVPQADLDLHGLDRETARDRVRTFLSESARRGVEVVAVIHGKGERVLAEMTRRELDDHAAVVEHIEAPAALGGTGARVARLRKG